MSEPLVEGTAAGGGLDVEFVEATIREGLRGEGELQPFKALNALAALVADREALQRRIDAFRQYAWEHLIQTGDDGNTASGYGPTDIPDELLIDAIVDESAARVALQRERDELKELADLRNTRLLILAGRVGVLVAALRSADEARTDVRRAKLTGELFEVVAYQIPAAEWDQVRAVLAGGEAGGQGQDALKSRSQLDEEAQHRAWDDE